MLNESESVAFEKCLIYASQLLGFTSKVRPFMSKENSVSIKKNPFHFWLNFNKYKEGEFAELDATVLGPISYQGQAYIPTVRNLFYKYINFNAINKHQSVLWKG